MNFFCVCASIVDASSLFLFIYSCDKRELNGLSILGWPGVLRCLRKDEHRNRVKMVSVTLPGNCLAHKCRPSCSYRKNKSLLRACHPLLISKHSKN